MADSKMTYGGMFVALAPLIMRLAAEGKTPTEIAALAPPCGRERLSPSMARYIINRNSRPAWRNHYYDATHPDAVEANNAFAAKFRAQWEEWERTSHLTPFERDACILYAILGWMREELEARRR